MTYTVSPSGNTDMVLGYLAGLDDASTPAYAVVFAGSAPLVTIVFARPPAKLVAGELVFEQGDPSGDQIMAQGAADRFELYSGSGHLKGEGDVSAIDGDGAMKVTGTAPSSTMLYAGARAIVGVLKMA